MSMGENGLVVIGENLNATRKIKSDSVRIVHDDGRYHLPYEDLDGTERRLDVTEAFPDDESNLNTVAYVAQALRNKDVDYLTWAIRAQEAAGSHIIDLCVDEMSIHKEERGEWMRYLVRTAQSVSDVVVSIDSSESETVIAGLEVHDASKSRPAINSVNLEDGRLDLLDLAREANAYLFANAGAQVGLPADAAERVANLTELMARMDAAQIPMEDRFLDPLVFPIGAGSEFGGHYLDAVRELRQAFPEVHIFGGHSNVSFGLPGRKTLNNAFLILAIVAGCDAIMIDPLMNPPRELAEFRLAADVATGKDDFALKYLEHWRDQRR